MNGVFIHRRGSYYLLTGLTDNCAHWVHIVFSELIKYSNTASLTSTSGNLFHFTLISLTSLAEL